MPKWPQHTHPPIRVPPDFPGREHAAAQREMEHWRNRRGGYAGPVDQPDPYYEFNAAWHGVAMRYRSFVEALEALQASVDGIYDPLVEDSHEARYEQDDALYRVFVAGLSCLECLLYAVYFVSVAAQPSLGLPFSRLREIHSGKVRAALAANWPREGIVRVIDALRVDPDWEEWRDVRNVLTHRLTPPRTIGETDSATFQAGPAAYLDVQLTRSSLEQRRIWLNGQVKALVREIVAFSNARL